MTAEQEARLVRAFTALHALIDFCSSHPSCGSCIFHDYCELLHLGSFVDLPDAAYSALDLFPNHLKKRYEDLFREEKV